MKIIKRGKPPGERICRGTCQICGSILEANQSELKRESGYDQKESRDWEYWTGTCPICNSMVSFFPYQRQINCGELDYDHQRHNPRLDYY